MIIFDQQCDEQIEFWCFEFDIENIISNLISNSLNSFDREMDAVLETKEINLIIKNTEMGLEISYWDTGWGLISIKKDLKSLQKHLRAAGWLLVRRKAERECGL